MILQYSKKTINSLTYEEAESIQFCSLNLEGIISEEQELKDEEKQQIIFSQINNFLQTEAHNIGGEVYFFLGSKKLLDVKNIKIATLMNSGNSIKSYVFDADNDSEYIAFVLNNSGKTISRIV